MTNKPRRSFQPIIDAVAEIIPMADVLDHRRGDDLRRGGGVMWGLG